MGSAWAPDYLYCCNICTWQGLYNQYVFLYLWCKMYDVFFHKNTQSSLMLIFFSNKCACQNNPVAHQMFIVRLSRKNEILRCDNPSNPWYLSICEIPSHTLMKAKVPNGREWSGTRSEKPRDFHENSHAVLFSSAIWDTIRENDEKKIRPLLFMVSMGSQLVLH